jgi:hypothetical protein
MSSIEALQLADPKLRHRAAVTNGSLLLPGADGRSAMARRWKDLVELLKKEVSPDGDELTTPQMILVKQAALVALRIEQLQADAVSGADISDDDIVRLSNALSRLFTALAKQWAGKPKSTPSIAEHFARKRASA